jgi:hypothetical protein
MRKKVRAWVCVCSVKDALQMTLNQLAAGGVASWPANVKAREIVIVPTHDKGGGADKLMAKILNAEKCDSPARGCMLGLCDTDDDGCAMANLAFGSLYRQLYARG